MSQENFDKNLGWIEPEIIPEVDASSQKPKKIPKRVLTVFSLVMINVIAVDSLRTLPMSAEYGFTLVFYYLLAGLVFFIPTALVAAELATGWPKTGGIYVWVREAFGARLGFVIVWLQWFYNLVWYPTILSLVAATLAYIINPALVNNVYYMLLVVFGVFWGATIVNLYGMRVAGIMSNFAALIGTLIPMVFIIILGIVWMAQGHPIEIQFTTATFFPKITSINTLVLITAMLYGLVGTEMSAVHAQEVRDPQRDYPRALFWSTVIILFTLIFASLAIAVVVPVKELSILTGLLDAFQFFFNAFHMTWMMPVTAVLIICGSIGGVGAWIIGPTKSLLASSRDGILPAMFSKVNKYQSPSMLLIAQAIIFTALCSIFLLMPSVNSSFWVLTDVAAQLSLIVYLGMFAAAIYLRYKCPEVKRSFIVPGGKVGIWIVGLLGIISSLFAIAIGFLPPDQVHVGGILRYELILSAGIVIGCLVPLLIYGWQKKKSQM